MPSFLPDAHASEKLVPRLCGDTRDGRRLIAFWGLICWPEYYVVDLAVPIALIVFYVTLR